MMASSLIGNEFMGSDLAAVARANIIVALSASAQSGVGYRSFHLYSQRRARHEALSFHLYSTVADFIT